MKAFDIVVVDPASGLQPSAYGRKRSELFAYVSPGETAAGTRYAVNLEKDWTIGENSRWGSSIMDPSSLAWRRFFVDSVIAPLWNAGYRGFFMDTMDSYRLAVGKDRYSAMEEGLAELVRDIKKRFPEARLVFNRGFEIVERLHSEVFAVAAESLFSGYNPDKGGYYDITEPDRKWLLEKLLRLKGRGIPVVAIDYVAPGMRNKARDVSKKIRDFGIIPWVTDKDLSSLGVGSVEVVPRKILGLYDGDQTPDAVYSELLRFGALPLNHLGYSVEFHDLREPFTDMILDGRYAGVLVWPSAENSARPGFREWLVKIIGQGTKVVFLDFFGMPANELPEDLGIEATLLPSFKYPLRVVKKDEMMGFETAPTPLADNFIPVRIKNGKVLLRIADQEGNISDAAGITPWGGYVLSPYAVSQVFEDRAKWVIDPFKFFSDAFRLPLIPVPDTTTENGARLLLVHVDGDGFESRAEWLGGGYAAQEMLVNIFEKYRIPATVSVITGIISPDGLYPEKSGEFERYAQDIFRLPWIEAASHSFSHPFNWKKLETDTRDSGYNLKIPNYTFNIDKEIGGSLHYINTKLLPKGKMARIFQWTGDCVPGADALSAVYREGTGNMNGGDTEVSESFRSLTAVAPLGIGKNGWFQVFAPNQNENVYTNLWSSDFYGYQRVLETFRLTESPRRLKPVDIYYHFYSATKKASLKALDKVYSWASKEHLNSIFASEYVEKVLDFNRTVIALKGNGWLIRNSGNLRELRMPVTASYPDLARSSNVVGFNLHNDDRYIHLGPGGEAELHLQQQSGNKPYVAQVNGLLRDFLQTDKGFRFRLEGRVPMKLAIGNAGTCRLYSPSGAISPSSGLRTVTTYNLPEGARDLTLECR